MPIARVGSWHTPCSTDDGEFEPYGPRIGVLLMKMYYDYATMLAAFKGKEIDIMQLSLEPVDYLWFETNDPAHEQYSTAFYSEIGLFQYDINDAVVPTSIKSVRVALAYILDK
jgi:ABC-type transport system substrate-binding protein